MSTVVNIALVASAFVTAIVAIGGDTWEKDKTPVWTSITQRGWIAIVCLALTFGLGVWKELQARNEAEALTSQRDRMAEDSKIAREWVCANRERFNAFFSSNPKAKGICAPVEPSSTR
jgi:hypothetical protein